MNAHRYCSSLSFISLDTLKMEAVRKEVIKKKENFFDTMVGL